MTSTMYVLYIRHVIITSLLKLIINQFGSRLVPWFGCTYGGVNLRAIELLSRQNNEYNLLDNNHKYV